MSDLYLVLRRRLDDVVDWIDLGTETLFNARKRMGFSYETMGRKLHVSSKTWERWEKAGRVPRHELHAVAELLELEILWPAQPVAIRVSPELPEERRGRLEEQLILVLGIVQEIRDELVAQRELPEAGPEAHPQSG